MKDAITAQQRIYGLVIKGWFSKFLFRLAAKPAGV